MSFGVGINLWNAGVLGGDAGAALGPGGSDLQRILALSPSLLIWPANGAGWQGTSGGTLAASGQPLGLGVDLSQLQGKTLSEWLATAPAISNNGLFGTYTDNGDGTYTIGGGQSLRVAFASASLVNNRVYESTFEVVARSGTTSCDWCDTVPVAITTTGVQKVYGARATYDSTFRFLDINAGAASSITVRLPTIKALPGNHLRAGTWASPSDAARATYVIQTDPALYNVSGQPELVTNGTFASNVDNWGDLGSWTAGSVAWSASGAVVTVSSFQGAAQQVSADALNKVFVLSFDVVTSGGVGRVYAGNAANPSGSPNLNVSALAAGSYTYVFQSGYAALAVGLSSTSGSGDVVYDNISVKEIPVSQYKYALSFDGSSDYYSLLNAISITESMTVVRAFKRASAGIRSAGLGEGAGGGNPRDFFWQTTNVQSYSLSGTTKTVSGSSTETGSFVSTVRRNASQEIARLNGTQIDAQSASAVSGSFGRFGDVAGSYNNGEISFLAVFPTELTGANLALVEQIAAATNSAVLA